MTNDTPKRSPDDFTSLDDFLREEGILDEVVEVAKERVGELACMVAPADASESYKLLQNVAQCQKVDPYTGWDLDGLREVRKDIQDHQMFERTEFGIEETMLTAIVEARSESTWNITTLNKTAEKIREYLGLPSVRDLNPDIARMQDAAEKNKDKLAGLFPNLAIAAKNSE